MLCFFFIASCSSLENALSSQTSLRIRIRFCLKFSYHFLSPRVRCFCWFCLIFIIPHAFFNYTANLAWSLYLRMKQISCLGVCGLGQVDGKPASIILGNLPKSKAPTCTLVSVVCLWPFVHSLENSKFLWVYFLL